MLLSAELFVEDLKKKGLAYDVHEGDDGDTVVIFPYNGKQTLFIFSGNEGKSVSMYTVYEKVPDSKLTDMYVLCNSLNAKLKWLKFFVDDSNNLVVQDDAILTPETAAEECFELLIVRLKILDEVKGSIMRTIWS
ncbi:MAG: YbjN domain-containing protein [Ruminococcus sp.]|nr:YbjN domain-containing protein [Ruminococcus sp.]